MLDEQCKFKDQFDNLNMELEQLKSQQFTPNWEDAPEWANWLAQDKSGAWFWHIEKPCPRDTGNCSWIGGRYQSATKLNKNWQQTLQERPKPTPQVEVGQVWKCLKTLNEYVIQHLGITKIGEKWVESVTYIYDYSEYEDKEIYTRTMSDFLAKFERVQS